MNIEKCPWENRELGCDERYVKVALQEENKAVDESLGLVTLHIKIPNDLYDKLIEKANTEGLNLYAFSRDLLIKGIK